MLRVDLRIDRFSRFAAPLAIGIIAVAVASCGGGGSTSTTPQGGASSSPSTKPSVSPSSGASSSPSTSPSSGASSAPGSSPSPGASPAANFTFGGSHDSVTCTANTSCATPPVSLSAYGANGTTLLFVLSTPDASGTVTVYDALDNGDITPSGFPAYTPTSGAVQMYFEVYASASMTFPQTPPIQVTATSFGSATGCEFYGYVTNNGSGAWTQIAPASGSATIAAGTVNIPAVTLPGTETVNFKPQAFYGAIVCQ